MVIVSGARSAAQSACSPRSRALPRRRGGRAVDRIGQLTSLLIALARDDVAIDQLAFRKSLEARAPASVKALANDLACYAGFCARARGQGLPASKARIVAYLEDCEARAMKPASVARRLASLAVVHGLLGVASPTRAAVVRDALRGLRRRVDVTQRQAGPLRYGDGIGTAPVKGFTLSTLLEACPAHYRGCAMRHCCRSPMTQDCACRSWSWSPASISRPMTMAQPATVPRCSPCRARRQTRWGRGPMPGCRPIRCAVSVRGSGAVRSSQGRCFAGSVSCETARGPRACSRACRLRPAMSGGYRRLRSSALEPTQPSPRRRSRSEGSANAGGGPPDHQAHRAARCRRGNCQPVRRRARRGDRRSEHALLARRPHPGSVRHRRRCGADCTGLTLDVDFHRPALWSQARARRQCDRADAA